MVKWQVNEFEFGASIINKFVSFSFIGAFVMACYALIINLGTWLSKSKEYESVDLFLDVIFYAAGGAIGGSIAGLVGVSLLSALFYALFFGHYFKHVVPTMDSFQYVGLFFSLITLTVILKVFLFFSINILGFNFSKATITSTLVMTPLLVCLFILLSYFFLPELWDKLILNLTN